MRTFYTSNHPETSCLLTLVRTFGPRAALAAPRFCLDGDRDAERDGPLDCFERDTLALRGFDSLRSVDFALCKQ